MVISVPVDSGNIEVLAAPQGGVARLRIRADAGGEHRQWFHFRVSGARGLPVTLRIENASACSYPKGWDGYRACASVDRVHWFRVDTDFDGTTLEIRHTTDSDVVWFAYFAPYSLDRHLDRLAGWGQVDGVRLWRLGATLDGHDLDALQIADALQPARELSAPPDGRPVVWIVARQHPGETMAQWFVEGLLDRLLDPRDAQARQLRRRAMFCVVPNMNPDGSCRGHLRTNAAGANLNREWHAPSAERSPEVKCVRDAMDRTGVDLCLDVHGDEALPHNFIAGSEGIASWDPARAAQLDRFVTQWQRDNPDFQTTHGYPVPAPGTANLTMCTNQVAERFGCLAVTIEQPFKDTDDDPMPEVGWSPERAKRLGASVLGVVSDALECR